MTAKCTLNPLVFGSERATMTNWNRPDEGHVEQRKGRVFKMHAKVSKTFFLDVALQLPNAPEHTWSRQLHGHRLEITLTIAGAIDPHYGWVQDTQRIKEAFMPLHHTLDHGLLNKIPGLENPTAELLAVWIWQRLQPTLPQLSAVTIRPTQSSEVIYEGA